jgi:hypothetical protein
VFTGSSRCVQSRAAVWLEVMIRYWVWDLRSGCGASVMELAHCCRTGLTSASLRAHALRRQALRVACSTQAAYAEVSVNTGWHLGHLISPSHLCPGPGTAPGNAPLRAPTERLRDHGQVHWESGMRCGTSASASPPFALRGGRHTASMLHPTLQLCNKHRA